MQSVVKQQPGKLKDIDRPEPLNTENTFEYRELFFSVTDAKSVITFANDIFLRLSKYPQQEIMGQLHKIIRHPDMPRAVFDLFWDRLKAGQSVASYVKNLSKDGSYYWVMALAFPCSGGYLSIRLRPGSELFAKARKLYSQTLRCQQEQEKVTDKKTALKRSKQLLLDLLEQDGYSSYEEFMWNALQSEMRNREQMMHRTHPNGPNISIPPALIKLRAIMSDVVRAFDDRKQIHATLMGHSDYILKLARSIQLLSMNAQISSAKLNQEDISLSVVAEKMGLQSIRGEKELTELKELILKLSKGIGNLNFDIISAKLQVEMTIDFLQKQDAGVQTDRHSILSAEQAVKLLYEAFVPRLESIINDITQLPTYLNKLMASANDIERLLLELRFIHVTGKVEIARLSQVSTTIASTFEELIEEVHSAEKHLLELSELVQNQQQIKKKYLSLKEELKTLSRKFADL